MKLTRPNSERSLTIEWRNACLPDPERARVETEYGRAMITYADGSIDRLYESYQLARRDCNERGPNMQEWLRKDCLARISVSNAVKRFRPLEKQACFNFIFKVEG